MKRRTFLQQAGVLLTGAAAAAAGGESRPMDGDNSPNERRPTVLLTSPDSSLGAALAVALAEWYEVRPAGEPLFRDEDGTLEGILKGVSAVVHVARSDVAGTGSEVLDRRGREMYDLLTVAAAEGVELVVYLSSLRMMTGYDPAFQVAEDWRPVPTSDAGQLSHYLAECTCREFARERRLRAVVLRLGEVVRGEAGGLGPAEVPWVHQDDAVQAVRLALKAHFSGGAELRAWNVFHVAADVRGGRFPVTRAKRALGYRPRFNPSA